MPTVTKRKSIEVLDAIRLASEFFKATFGSERLKNVQLEEVEKSADGKFWLITLGYDEVTRDPLVTSALSRSLFPNGWHDRRFKVIRINAETGEPVAIKMRGKE